MNDSETRAELERIDPDIADMWDIYGKYSQIEEMITEGHAIGVSLRLLAEKHKALRPFTKLKCTAIASVGGKLRVTFNTPMVKGTSIKYWNDKIELAQTAIKEE